MLGTLNGPDGSVQYVLEDSGSWAARDGDEVTVSVLNRLFRPATTAQSAGSHHLSPAADAILGAAEFLELTPRVRQKDTMPPGVVY